MGPIASGARLSQPQQATTFVKLSYRGLHTDVAAAGLAPPPRSGSLTSLKDTFKIRPEVILILFLASLLLLLS
jgi:hypothetical protein